MGLFIIFVWYTTKDILLTGKISDLEIDSEDYAIYIAKYKDKIAELHLDYFGRKNIREIQIFLRRYHNRRYC